MIQFYSTLDESFFILKDREIEILQPVFDDFYNKTGLRIDEYKDIRLISQNLKLLSNIISKYKENIDDKIKLDILDCIDKKIKKMTIDENIIWVTGD